MPDWLAKLIPIRKLKTAGLAIAGGAVAGGLSAAEAIDWQGLGPWGPVLGGAVVWGIAWATRAVPKRTSEQLPPGGIPDPLPAPNDPTA